MIQLILRVGAGELLVERQPKSQRKPSYFLVSQFCAGNYLKYRLVEHQKICQENVEKKHYGRQTQIQAALKMAPETDKQNKLKTVFCRKEE